MSTQSETANTPVAADSQTIVESPLFPVIDCVKTCRRRISCSETNLTGSEHIEGVTNRDGFTVSSVQEAEQRLITYFATENIREVNTSMNLDFFVITLPEILVELSVSVNKRVRRLGNRVLMHSSFAAMIPYSKIIFDQCGQWKLNGIFKHLSVYSSDIMPKNEIIMFYRNPIEEPKINDGPAILLRNDKILTLIPVMKRSNTVCNAEDYFQAMRISYSEQSTL